MSAKTDQLIAEARHEQEREGNAVLECREASPFSRSMYFPCGKPAKRFILSERGQRVYPMCASCAAHNVKNRGAEDLGEATK